MNLQEHTHRIKQIMKVINKDFQIENKNSNLVEDKPNRYVSSDNLIYVRNPTTDGYNEIWVSFGLNSSQEEKVGYIILSPARKEYYWIDINLPNPLAISDINILPEYRGQGYMKQTMIWLENFAKENGFKSLFLRVDDDSDISQESLTQIYLKFGFKIYKTYTDEDDIFMYKLL